MKTVITIMFVFLLWAGKVFPFSFFYHSIPSTLFETTPGFKFKEKIYFLLHHRLYLRPKGIATFPDGGQSKTLVDKLYLCLYSTPLPQIVVEIHQDISLKGVYFKTSDINPGQDRVLIKIPYYNYKQKARQHRLILVNLDAKTSTFAKTADEQWPSESMGIMDTIRPFKKFYHFDQLGLSNPVDFSSASTSPKSLAKSIMHGEGDQSFRLAAAQRLLTTGNKKLLEQVANDIGKNFPSKIKHLIPEEKEILSNMLKNHNAKDSP